MPCVSRRIRNGPRDLRFLYRERDFSASFRIPYVVVAPMDVRYCPGRLGMPRPPRGIFPRPRKQPFTPLLRRPTPGVHRTGRKASQPRDVERPSPCLAHHLAHASCRQYSLHDTRAPSLLAIATKKNQRFANPTANCKAISGSLRSTSTSSAARKFPYSCSCQSNHCSCSRLRPQWGHCLPLYTE